MGHGKRNNVVVTVKNKCRVCYTCVRECPVKAIKIINGQAEVLGERCIACGNCVKVCSQGAKIYLSSKDEVFSLLGGGDDVVACVAPSFPAEFPEIKDYHKFVGMVAALGFDKIIEVSFGADLVANAYSNLQKEHPDRTTITSDCPAIVYYIEHYYPNLIENLAPIASPMVAINRLVKEKYGDSTKVVFIGPCIAKKAESAELDAVITFLELRQMFAEKAILPEHVEARDFDPPYSGKGAVFPVSKGMLHTMGRKDDLAVGEIIVAEGKQNFREVIEELENGELDAKHMELLCCEGCIMGPGMSPDGKRYKRSAAISKYARKKLENLDVEQWNADLELWKDLDLSQSFEELDRRKSEPLVDEIQEVLQKMGKNDPKDHLNCGACGYSTCEKHAIAIIDGLAEHEMCLPYSIEKLHQSIEELNDSNDQLDNAKKALKHSEKLANMGQLSAGIAHELNNPLGVITMYSNILLDELSDDNEMKEDLHLIVEQADRCKKIVGGLLNFARKNQVKKNEINIDEFCKHSLTSVVVPAHVKVKVITEIEDPMMEIDKDQMMQVLTNLEKNAIEAMPQGGKLSIRLYDSPEQVQIIVADTGSGITEENMEKIFTPFFTTKGLGKGTGLGLPLIYGIIKMHKGLIEVKSNADEQKGPTGTSFIISLPRH